MNDYPKDDDGDALRRVAADGSDLSKPMQVDFMVAAGDAESGRRIAAAAERLGYRTEVVRDADDEDDVVEADADEHPWTVYCTKTMILTYAAVVEAQEELDRLGRPFGGHSDGWGTFGNASR